MAEGLCGSKACGSRACGFKACGSRALWLKGLWLKGLVTQGACGSSSLSAQQNEQCMVLLHVVTQNICGDGISGEIVTE